MIINFIGRGGGIWGSGDADIHTDKERESSRQDCGGQER